MKKITRQEFIKSSLILGVSLPFISSFLVSCEDEQGVVLPKFETNFSGKVIVIGAGASGLCAGYLLQRHNIDFEIIEASSTFGGRVKRATGFADFPIDLGAEWIHASPSILADIVDDPTKNSNIEFITYNPQEISAWNNGKLREHNYASNFYSEYKFKNTTWFGFFERYIVSEFVDKITYNQPIVEIDYSANKVLVRSIDNTVYEADKVLVTVPIKILQGRTINFIPEMPVIKQDAINSISMGDGIKVFIEFKKRFYPDILAIGRLIETLSSSDKVFYDVAFRKDSNKNIFGLFAVQEKASPYTDLNSDQEIVDKILVELDEIYDGKASANYIKHLVQNWSKEPYIKGSYSANGDGLTIDTIKQPLNNRVYFAGEALANNGSATVHGACEDGFQAIKLILTSNT
ncbi:NAD(P)/FAD-dependent oxidoreductase [Seonamhaeicola sp.]|uniref:flavin monoamine oxidase family protein n=1 Tax=Seonamhaeicola sp. TaxID=1912245 RepID=UPI002620F6FA|nr:NAD(P)/FAD-dependent oxidoreductase [Seonamhaeicola sp.]